MGTDLHRPLRPAATAVRRLVKAIAAAERGSAAVEFALVSPLLILMVFGVVEFGRALWTQSLLDFAVEQASRCASINTDTCSTAAAIETYASQQTSPLDIPASTFSISTTTCGNKVTASYPFKFAASTLLPYAITLTSQSCFPL